jgi:asparagine synthase (glutamine-hydrolysing)
MSGIVGIFRRDGGPVEPALLQALTRFLSFRGPDACQVWSEGPVGLGHAMLRTTHEASRERQPASLDGQFWITAHARLDGRAELEDRLGSARRDGRRAAPDSELLLQAYAAWGEQCLERLRGEFAFAIWDARRRTLFCAHDQFGVRPFYYAALGDLFLFSNTLNCLRAHPDVGDELNEAAIADFLMFGLNCDAETTTFRDVRRLPRAHFVAASAEGIRLERYWSLPVNGRIRYRRPEEYVEHFQMILRAAVADRLRTDRVGIFLSGGLDSSALAATARELSAEFTPPVDLRAYAVTHETLPGDQAREYAPQVAEFLKIPLRCLPMGGAKLFERWDDPEIAWPEPLEVPFPTRLFDQIRAIAGDCRVAFNGEGPDNLMFFQMWPYVRSLWRNREWGRLLADVPHFLWVRPFPWRGLRQRVRAFLGRDADAPMFPRWMAPDFARRMEVETRWTAYLQGVGRFGPEQRHPVMPKAHASLALPQWSQFFEMGDAGVTRCPVEMRYPFVDLRVVDYILALPPFPWAFHKRLLRAAMAGRLPEQIRLRRKRPFGHDPSVEEVRRPEAAWLDQVRWSPEIERYVDCAAVPKLRGQTNAQSVSVTIRAMCLNFWLQSGRQTQYRLSRED